MASDRFQIFLIDPAVACDVSIRKRCRARPVWTPLQVSGGATMEKLKQFGGQTPMGRPGNLRNSLRSTSSCCAFHMTMANFQRSIVDPKGKRIRVVVQHPLGKLTCAFDKKNSEKIKGWLSSPATQTG